MSAVHHKSHHHHDRGPGRRNHLQTDFIVINSWQCTACGNCRDECPRGVIGQVKWFKHSHAHIDKADQCIGCKKCVKACPQQAISESPLAAAGLSGRGAQGDKCSRTHQGNLLIFDH